MRPGSTKCAAGPGPPRRGQAALQVLMLICRSSRAVSWATRSAPARGEALPQLGHERLPSFRPDLARGLPENLCRSRHRAVVLPGPAHAAATARAGASLSALAD
jgi:hypothetical protein